MTNFVQLVALHNFSGPEGAKGGERKGIVYKGTVFTTSGARASELMRRGMAEPYEPKAVGPSANKRQDPVEVQSEPKEYKRRGRKSKGDAVDESDSDSDAS